MERRFERQQQMKRFHDPELVVLTERNQKLEAEEQERPEQPPQEKKDHDVAKDVGAGLRTNDGKVSETEIEARRGRKVVMAAPVGMEKDAALIHDSTTEVAPNAPQYEGFMNLSQGQDQNGTPFGFVLLSQWTGAISSPRPRPLVLNRNSPRPGLVESRATNTHEDE